MMSQSFQSFSSTLFKILEQKEGFYCIAVNTVVQYLISENNS